MSKEKITKTIHHIVRDSLEGKPIVVWYDKGGTLEDIILKAVPDGIIFVPFEGRYLKIRKTIDSQDPGIEKRWFVYITEERQARSWIRDYELMGSCIEKTVEKLLTENYGLKSNTEIRELLKGDRGKLLVKHWDTAIGEVKKNLTQKQLIDGLLAVTFEIYPFDLKRAVLNLLHDSRRYLTKLTKMSLQKKFAERVKQLLGIDILNAEGVVNPEALASALLLSEFVYSSNGQCKDEFQGIIVPDEKLEQAKSIVEEWVSNIILRASFFKLSGQIGEKYNIKSRLQATETMADVLSFKEIDEILKDELLARLKGEHGDFKEHAELAGAIAKKRMEKIWFKSGKANFWDSFHISSQLIGNIQKYKRTLRGMSEDPEAYFNEYLRENGWWFADNCILDLYSKTTDDDDINEYVVLPSMKEYTNWLYEVNNKFAECISKMAEWVFDSALQQKLFWEHVIAPDQDAVAIFYIDALRADLAFQLIKSLEDKGSEVRKEAMVSMLPSITEVCMPVLLPNHRNEVKIEVTDSKIKIFLAGTAITNKADRKAWIESKMPESIVLDNLDEVNSLRLDDLKAKIGDKRFIFVMDREIDQLGTFLADIDVSVLKESVEKVSRGVSRIHEIGIEKVMIATDHGFLFFPKHSKIETISGIQTNIDTYKGRRFLIGKPPVNPSLIQLDLKEIGFASDCIAQFPRGTICVANPGAFIHGGISLQENALLFLTSVVKRERKEKVDIEVDVPDPITTAIFFVEIKPVIKNKLTYRPRKLVVEVQETAKKVEESKEEKDKTFLAVSDEEIIEYKPIKVSIPLKKIPSEIHVTVKDVDTGVYLYHKDVKVELGGYDDLI